MLKKLGATTDSSFNQELVRIQIDAFAEFVEELIPGDRKETVSRALRRAGVHGSDLKGVLLSAVSKLGERVAGAAGEKVAKETAEIVGPALKDLLVSGGAVITATWKQYFRSK